MRPCEPASRASPTPRLCEAATPFLEDLHAVVGHHVQLGVREEHEVLFVERLSAPGTVINLTRSADRLPLHASSSGIVLLAHAPGWLQEQVLAGPLHAYTPRTVVAPGELRAVLTDARRNGVALCRGFIDTRTTGVAVPLRDSGNTVIAALSVIVPNEDSARIHVPALQAAARGISRAVGGDPRGAHRHFAH